MSTVKVIGMCLIALFVVLGLAWIFQGNEFFMYKVFAPKQEAVRRQVFEQTKSYNQGYIQELQNMQFQYVAQADQKSKDALASIILHRAADYDESKLPSDLRSFIATLKQEQAGTTFNK